MFGTIRKHQSWLWFIIIAVVILGMITWQNQLGKSGNEVGSPGNFGVIDNKPITAAEMRTARNETSIMYFLHSHEWPDSPRAGSNFDLDRESYQRLFLIRKLHEYNIRSDDDTVAAAAGMLLRQFGNNGQQPQLSDFVEQILKPKGISAEDFQSFLEHDLSIQQLSSVLGLSGKLVTPAEVQSLYVQEYQELAVDVAFFSASNYLAKIPEPTPEALGQFYTNQQAMYREPDQMQVSYVLYNVTNFMPAAEQQMGTNLNGEVDAVLTKLGTNGLRYGKTPEESRSKIRELLVQEVALTNAYAKAVAFQKELVTKEPLHADNLAELAKEKGVEVKVTKPFDQKYGPSELNLGADFPVAAFFNLTPEEPFVELPIRGSDGVYIVGFNKLIPSRVPPLAEIHTRVVSEYKFSQALRMAQINGHVFAQTVTNEMAHGKTFSAVCDATRVTPAALAPFSLNTESLPEVEEHTDLGTFKSVAFGTQDGKCSGFAPTQDGGYVVHARARLPIDQAKMKTQLPEFSNLVRQRRQNEAFEQWFGREASIALRDIPAFKPRDQTPGAAR